MNNSFDLMAQSFDTDYRIKRANIVANEIKKRINISKKDNVLEFGCGTGLVTVNLISSINNISLVDSSEGMLNQLKHKLSTITTNTKINIFNNIFANSIKKTTYDLIYSSMVLHHIKDIELFSKRFNELLCVNGTLCIIDLLPVDKSYHINEPDFDGYHGFNPEWIINILEEQGFRKEIYDVIYNDSKVINNERINYSLFILIMNKS